MSRARSAGTDLRTGSHPAVELAGPAARDEGLPPAHGEGQHGAGRVLAIPHADTAGLALNLDAVTAGVAVTRLDPHLPGSLTVIGDIGRQPCRWRRRAAPRSSGTSLDAHLAFVLTSALHPWSPAWAGRVRGG